LSILAFVERLSSIHGFHRQSEATMRYLRLIFIDEQQYGAMLKREQHACV